MTQYCFLDIVQSEIPYILPIVNTNLVNFQTISNIHVSFSKDDAKGSWKPINAIIVCLLAAAGTGVTTIINLLS